MFKKIALNNFVSLLGTIIELTQSGKVVWREVNERDGTEFEGLVKDFPGMVSFSVGHLSGGAPILRVSCSNQEEYQYQDDYVRFVVEAIQGVSSLPEHLTTLLNTTLEEQYHAREAHAQNMLKLLRSMHIKK